MPYDAITSDSDPSGVPLLLIAGAAMADLALPAERKVPWAGAAVPSGASSTEGTSVDSERFDNLVRGFGHGASRRRLLAGLVGASLVGTLGHATVSARGKRHLKAQD